MSACSSAPTPVPATPELETTPTSGPTASTEGPAENVPAMPTPTMAVAIPRSAEDLQLIEPEEVLALIEAGSDIVIVDNQPAEVYAEERIKGAVSFPWEAQIPSPKDLPKDKLLILYCGCAHEEDSTDVAMQLIKRGYTKIMLLNGGSLRWSELGYPTDKGGGQ